MLVGGGSVRSGGLDIGNLMKPALARGQLHCIGATTLDEHRKYFEKDAALERRFQPVMVQEPSPAEALVILEGLKVGCTVCCGCCTSPIYRESDSDYQNGCRAQHASKAVFMLQVVHADQITASAAANILVCAMGTQALNSTQS